MSPEQPAPFPWESPLPQGPFWTPLLPTHSHIARTYLTVFGAPTIATMSLDASLPPPAKLSQLLDQATSHLSASPLLSHPAPATLSQVDFQSYRRIVFLLASLEVETGLTAQPEARYTSLAAAVRARFDAGIDADVKSPEDISSLNGLASLYVRRGRWAEAEALAGKLPGLMRGHPVLGPGPSPQEMGARRMLVEVLARQGRVEEARGEVEEGYKVVEEMRGGKFERYVGEEVEALDEVRGKIEGWSRGEA